VITLLIVAIILCLVIWLARTYQPAPICSLDTIVVVAVALVVIISLLSMVLPLGGTIPPLR